MTTITIDHLGRQCLDRLACLRLLDHASAGYVSAAGNSTPLGPLPYSRRGDAIYLAVPPQTHFRFGSAPTVLTLVVTAPEHTQPPWLVRIAGPARRVGRGERRQIQLIATTVSGYLERNVHRA